MFYDICYIYIWCNIYDIINVYIYIYLYLCVHVIIYKYLYLYLLVHMHMIIHDIDMFFRLEPAGPVI